ncbi:MAG TPA: hypothetical protein VJQ51_10870 [Burkholderiales bacterium]|nr:hypothetical protein [Burkholderiales bacterium]
MVTHDHKPEAGNGVMLTTLGPEAARLFDEHLRTIEQRAQNAQKLLGSAKWLVLLALVSLASTIFYILNSLAEALF